MTVKELIEELQKHDGEWPVHVGMRREFSVEVNSLSVDEVYRDGTPEGMMVVIV